MKSLSRQGIAIVSLAAFAAVGAGCTSSRRANSGAVIGGVAGAGAGALIGSKTGSWGKGALIGAGAGALLGYVVANETDPKNDRYVPPPPPPRSVVVTDSVEARKNEASRQFQVAMSSEDSATAEYHFRQSIDFYPTTHAYNNLGLLHLKNGDHDRARENFRAALRLDPSYTPALDNLERLGKASG